jgi:hypothetical protein
VRKCLRRCGFGALSDVTVDEFAMSRRHGYTLGELDLKIGTIVQLHSGKYANALVNFAR